MEGKENENSIESSARRFVREHMRTNDPSHDWLHVERVYANAVYIAVHDEKLAHSVVDLEVVKLAALFHDLVDFKYEQQHQQQQQNANNALGDHDKKKSLDEVARDRLDRFFAQFDNYPREKIEKIHYIITNISWRKELECIEKGIEQILSPELRIVRDADRLDAIGAIGVARCFSYGGHKMRAFYDKSELANLMTRDDSLRRANENELISYETYNQQTIRNEGFTLAHFFEKLFFIKDRMQTDTGKRLAQERHEFLIAFVRQFLNELT